MQHDSAVEHQPGEPKRGFLAWWHRTPLYLRIVGALIIGLFVGAALGPRAQVLDVPAKMILRLLGALAPTLILIAVINALVNTNIKGRMAGKLAGLLVLNTVVAICIGLLVANVVQPGRGADLSPPPPHEVVKKAADPLTQFLDNVPKSLLGPLGDNANVIGVIFIAVAFGIALRDRKDEPVQSVQDLLNIAMNTMLRVLHWIIDVVPIGVFGIVASIVGKEGFHPFVSLGKFIVAVLLALALQATYYLLRIRFASWVRPGQLLRGTRDALVMAFSTASSTITMPITYSCLKDRVKIREQSASMGALVGSNFNNDGTALYEAMSALFIAQMIGMDLSLEKQLLVVLTSIVASVGAAGIPEAGLVTMTLVFTAVGLPTNYIALLLTADWFLDRCRTTINVMGDMNVSCVLDGKTPPAQPAQPASIPV